MGACEGELWWLLYFASSNAWFNALVPAAVAEFPAPWERVLEAEESLQRSEWERNGSFIFLHMTHSSFQHVDSAAAYGSCQRSLYYIADFWQDGQEATWIKMPHESKLPVSMVIDRHVFLQESTDGKTIDVQVKMHCPRISTTLRNTRIRAPQH